MKLEKTTIIDIENKLMDAIKISELKVLDELLHQDLLFIAPNGQTVTKEMDLASHKAGQMVVDEIILTIEQINIIDDIAIVIVVYDTKGKMLGTPIEGNFRYIRFWKKFQDSLKVIGGSCSKV